MPRNSSGTYTLPAGNPVVTGSVISSSWANTTLSDLGTAMTDSLSRSGDGGMLAPLLLDDGAIGAPGLTWTTETTSGWYRAAANDFRFVIGGANKFTITSSGFSGAITGTITGSATFSGVITFTSSFVALTGGTTLSSVQPVLRWLETGASANTGRWLMNAFGGQFNLYTADDIETTVRSVLAATRSGVAVSTVTLGNATDNPTYTFAGTGAGTSANPWTWSGTHTFNGDINLAQSSTGWTIGKSGADAYLAGYVSTNAADTKRWDFKILDTSGTFGIRAINDAYTVAREALAVSRSGVSITSIALGNTTDNPILTYNGIEVGYRGLPQRVVSGSTSTVAADAGKCIIYNGTGGHTVTLATGTIPAEGVVTIINFGSAAITIAETLSGDLNWLNGSGSYLAGSRTLAAAGVCSVFMQSTTTAYIWGTGLS